MKKYIPILILALVVAAMPARAAEPAESEAQEMALDIETATVNIIVNGRQVRVTNAEGEELEVYNLTGTCVATVHIDSEDKTVNLNLPKGCYILKVGKIARKVSIR